MKPIKGKFVFLTLILVYPNMNPLLWAGPITPEEFCPIQWNGGGVSFAFIYADMFTEQLCFSQMNTFKAEEMQIFRIVTVWY